MSASPNMNPFTFEEYSASYHTLRKITAEHPVSKRMPELLALIKENRVVVFVGETGSGKTTQLAKRLLETDPEVQKSGDKMIALTQPRQLAASSVAARIAEELEVKLGSIVGVRYKGRDDTTKGTTRLEVVTDGTLLKVSASDKTLTKYKYILIDEAHERTTQTDLLLERLAEISKSRSDLRVIIMSATLDSDRLVEYFPGAKLFTVGGRSHKVQLNFLPMTPSNLADETVKVILQIHLTECEGNILVFASGVKEIRDIIRDVKEALEGNSRGENRRFRPSDMGPLAYYALHAQIPMSEQEAAVSALPPRSSVPGRFGRKLIVSTNVAETSITIPGVVHVVDMLTTKVKLWNSRDETWAMRELPTSKARCKQRVGRAGREREGKAYVMCTADTYHKELAEQSPPSILEGDMLSEMLEIRAFGKDPLRVNYLTAPATETLVCGLELLARLGIMTTDGQLTNLGQVATLLPLAPHLSVMVHSASKLGCSSEMLSLAAMLSATDGEVNLWRKPRNDEEEAALEAARAKLGHPRGGLFDLFNVYMSYRNARLESRQAASAFCDEYMLLERVLKNADETRLQLQKILTTRASKSWSETELKPDDPHYWTKMTRAICAGFFLRAAKRSDPIVDPDNKDPDPRTHKGNLNRYTTVRHEVKALKFAAHGGTPDDSEWIVYDECSVGGVTRLSLATVVRLEYLIEAKPSYWSELESFPAGSIKTAVSSALSSMTGMTTAELEVSMPKPASLHRRPLPVTPQFSY